MKTAMQELIDKIILESNSDKPTFQQKYILIWVKYMAEELLEKEKEQMLNFYMWMRMNENTEKYLDYSDEDMFKEYLNQDK
jgi:hypothetical protein